MKGRAKAVEQAHKGAPLQCWIVRPLVTAPQTWCSDADHWLRSLGLGLREHRSLSLIREGTLDPSASPVMPLVGRSFQHRWRLWKLAVAS